jgi:SPP1 family predicted phage head-tail adaptor
MTVMVRAGELRERITLQTSTGYTRSPTGAPSRTWATLATVRARVTSGGGSEYVQGGSESTVLGSVFRIRHRTDVSTEHRIAFPSTSDLWDIQAVIDVDGLGKVLDLVALKRTT